MRHPEPYAALAIVLAVLAGGAYAQDAAPDTQQAAPAESPPPLPPALGLDKGPVTVTADQAEWERSGVMLYTGNVQLSSAELKLSGDRIELRQFGDGRYEAHITGKPARLDHSGKTGDPGEEVVPVTAVGSTLQFDSRTGIVEIKEGARLTRGGDSVTGDVIRYDVTARRIRAAGGETGQVRIVIQPPPEARARQAGPKP